MLRYTIRSSCRTCSFKKRATSDAQHLHTSASRKDEVQSISETVKAKVQIENEVVSIMDRFMTTIRERADPVYHNNGVYTSTELNNDTFSSIVPKRIPMLWAEALTTSTERPLFSTSTPVEVDLTPRSMHDSYSEVVLPFGSSKEFFERYTNASGGIRMGKLMEHLDSLAGSIAYKHMLGPVQNLGNLEQRGFYIVTASVDRLDMLSSLDPTRDLRLSGHVIYTGRSSIEVGIRMESIGTNQLPKTVMIGRFSMACRDTSTQKARQVNPLAIHSPEEMALYDLGAQIKQRRQYQALRSLSKVPPSSSEAADLHSFYLQHGEGYVFGKDGSADHIWMGDTVQERCMLMFPQERNVHGKIFGGYLMRLAYELGFTNASMLTRGHVHFISSDGISFAHPVPIGSILRLRSQVLHTLSSEFPGIIHVGVKANVVDVKTGNEQTTNDFRFTWCQEKTECPNLRTVVPKTYKEAMLWLEGKRALELGFEIRGSRSSKSVE